MWKVYLAMIECMPNSSMRMNDNRPKFPAFLLTFSQTALNIDYAYRQLLKLQFPITEVVMEEHVDGGLHIHAMLVGNRRRKLSPESATVGSERPNIRGKGSKAILDARYYIRKSYVDARGLQDLDDKKNSTQRLLHQKSYDDAVRLWPGVDPKGYIYNRINGEIGLRMHYEKKVPVRYVPSFPMESFVVPVVVRDWIDKYVNGSYIRPVSLILWGMTRTGKTEFARAIDTHWYMNTDWDVSQINEDAKYGIIDDIPSERFMYWRAFLGGQKQITVTDKFHRKKQLLWGKPVIWLSNYDPVEWKGVDYSWIIADGDESRANAIVVKVDAPMYGEYVSFV